MSQFCYLTHWTRSKPQTEANQPNPQSKAVRKFICFLTNPRSIQNVSITNKDRG